ncbi:MAG TPA: hypothetical protein VGS08_02710 [Candidatus Saccharimonadales bacterium]|nr:hypothetical protein [Candidatus Saccharimonadales bacterium]
MKDINKESTIQRPADNFNKLGIIIVLLLFGAIGTYLLVNSHASTPAVSLQATSGNLSGNATVVNNQGASNGKAVRFGNGSNAQIHWLIAISAAQNLVNSGGSTGANFIQSINSSSTYEIEPQNSTSSDPLPNATHVMTFQSYQDMQTAFASSHVPSNVQIILYDNEAWTGTPAVEQMQPFTYVPQAEQLAHAKGKLFMNSPAADLTSVLDPSASDNYTGYLQEKLATLSQYTDIFEIQAQNEPTVAGFQSFATQAVAEARTANPHALVLLGITAKQNGPSPQNLINEVTATKSITDGYWLNIPGGDVSVALPLLAAWPSM